MTYLISVLILSYAYIKSLKLHTPRKQQKMNARPE